MVVNLSMWCRKCIRFEFEQSVGKQKDAYPPYLAPLTSEEQRDEKSLVIPRFLPAVEMTAQMGKSSTTSRTAICTKLAPPRIIFVELKVFGDGGAIGTEPGGEVRDRMKGQTV